MVGNSIRLEKKIAYKAYRDDPNEVSAARGEEEELFWGVEEIAHCEPHSQNATLWPWTALQTPKRDWKATRVFGSLTTLCGHYYYCGCCMHYHPPFV